MKPIKLFLKSSLFVITAFFLFTSQTVFCQTEKLGIVNYTPPKGMTKTLKENVVAFSEFDQATGGFCIITLYGATPGTGNPTGDFTREWNNLVVKVFAAEANPQTETVAEGGWTAIGGGSAVEYQGSKAVVFLTVVSGYGKTVSVLGVFNQQPSAAQVAAFAASIEMDKIIAPTNTAPTNKAPAGNPAANQNNAAGKFGSVKYAKPAGWSEQQFADGVIFKPSDLPAAEHLVIQIMPPLNASGTLEQALRASFDEAAAMYQGTQMTQKDGNYEKNDSRKSFSGWEYIRGKGGLRAKDGTGYERELGLELFVIKVNNRFERVAILETRPDCGYSRYFSSDRRIYKDDVENFLFTLQFADSGESVSKPGSLTGSGIIGVWQGVSMSGGQTSVSEPAGIGYKGFSAIFLTNGLAYFGPGFPEQGLDGLNIRTPEDINQRSWAIYTFSNGKGNLRMDNGTNIPLRMQNNKLVITTNQTDHAYHQLNSVDGATFNGTYVLDADEGKIPAITFTSDGRFTDNGAMEVLYHETIKCINPAVTTGSGTYEVKDYSVIFKYTDGRKIKLAFFGSNYTKGNPSPATLRMSFMEDRLTRR